MQSVELPATKKNNISIPRLLDGKHFSIKERNKYKVDAICMTCGRICKGDVRSTGNFMDHYTSAHEELVKKVKDHRIKKVVESMPANNSQQTSMFVFAKPIEN